MSLMSKKPFRLLTLVGLAAVGMLVAAQSVSATIIRPNSATPMGISMVIAYNACTVVGGSPPTNTHNPANLPGDACTPPVKSTSRLTAGDPTQNGAPANFKGNVKLVVKTTAPDDVLFPCGGVFPSPSTCLPDGAGKVTLANANRNYFQDVRCESSYASGPGAGVCTNANANALPDYKGALNVISNIRITDEANSGPAATCNGTDTSGCTNDATIANLNFAVPADCIDTAATNIGGFCTPRYASAGAICGCVATGHRSNIELGQVFAMDGGDDGVVAPLAPDPGAQTYARMGLFLP